MNKSLQACPPLPGVYSFDLLIDLNKYLKYHRLLTEKVTRAAEKCEIWVDGDALTEKHPLVKEMQVC